MGVDDLWVTFHKRLKANFVTFVKVKMHLILEITTDERPEAKKSANLLGQLPMRGRHKSCYQQNFLQEENVSKCPQIAFSHNLKYSADLT